MSRLPLPVSQSAKPVRGGAVAYRHDPPPVPRHDHGPVALHSYLQYPDRRYRLHDVARYAGRLKGLAHGLMSAATVRRFDNSHSTPRFGHVNTMDGNDIDASGRSRYHAAMTTDDFIQHFGKGNVTHAARNSGFRRATIYGWINAGYIPPESQYRAEIVSEGALRAERPDDTRQSGDQP